MDNNDTAALPSWIPELDLYLFDRGEAQQAYRVFGCHPGRLLPDGASTHRFVVWAPHARSVHVVGDFNDWDCAAHALQLVHEGVWAGEIPGLADGDIYKYAIEGPDGTVSLKADPFAFHAENGLHTASKVWDLAGYAWQDEAWMQARAMADPLHSPLSIYELHLGSWRLAEGETYPNYRAIAHELAAYCVEMGYTHVELMPLAEYL